MFMENIYTEMLTTGIDYPLLPHHTASQFPYIGQQLPAARFLSYS
jgi:hypothetical protein